MTAAPPALPGIDHLWPICLEAARIRRTSGSTGDMPSPSTVLGLRQMLWDETASAAVELFEPLLSPFSASSSTARPFVIGQLGQSLDGCIATHRGDANFVNGPELLVHLHRLRALSDAVVIGAATASIDNPQLTTRKVDGPNPVRVVIDPTLRLSSSLKVFADRQATTWLACDSCRAQEAESRFGNDQVLGVPDFVQADGSLSMQALLAALQVRGIGVVFVEGGGVTVSRFIAQGCMDRLHLSIAPVMIGDGRRGLQLPRNDAMGSCPRPQGRMHRMGQDMLWDLDLRSA